MTLPSPGRPSASHLSGDLSSALQSHVHSRLPAFLAQALLRWPSDTRLHRLEVASASADALPVELLVESFVLHEAVSHPFSVYINALVLDAHIELKHLLMRPLSLVTQLADGSHVRRSGYVTNAWSLDADGGFARKGLMLRPWIAFLGEGLASRVWQDKSVIEIVEDVFSPYASVSAWRWDVGVPAHVAQGLFARNGGRRSYCVQYRESDLDFVQRLLAEESLCWRVEEDPAAPGGHTVVIFADSHGQPQDATSAGTSTTGLGGAGIRFHRSSSQEEQDSIQALSAVRAIGPTAKAVQGWDYLSSQAISAEAPTHHDWAGGEADSLNAWLQDYDPTGDFIFGTQAEARFAATRLQEAHEARYKSWLGRASVRSLRAGTWMAITQSTLEPLQALGQRPQDRQFFVHATHAVGLNNLPGELREALVRSIGRGELAELDEMQGPANAHTGLAGWQLDTDALHAQAERTGYACQFQAVRRDIPWRAVLLDEWGARPRPRPTALGPQTAIVVGPGGRTAPEGADELHTDRLGRVQVRFHWQAQPHGAAQASSATSPAQHSHHSCWLRVMQRLAGPGMGHQFIPRIGQEVLVGFLNNDVDRPYVISSLYSGRGQGGVQRTPGGRAPSQDSQAHTAVFADASDHRPSGQMNEVGSGTGGHSPAWHGAAPGVASEGHAGQNNAAALSGVKSKEFGGWGHNQLVLDDTPDQQRLLLHSTHRQSWLQMGHLLHQADNHRGSFRGQGFELRTDAWGGLRAVRGVMLSTFGLRNGLGQTAEGAGDNAAGIALARQMQQLAHAFHQAASTHQTVGLATAAGSTGAGQSARNDEKAPAAALAHSLAGMVSSRDLPSAVADAQAGHTGTGQSKVPHMSEPHIALIGKAGVGLTAGQDVHFSAQDTASIASGQDTHVAVGGQARLHAGQAIGVLAGAMQAGGAAGDAADNPAGKGLTVIAAQGDIDMQAQAGAAQVAALQAMEIMSAKGEVQLQGKKSVQLAVSGGAHIRLSAQGVEVACPGTLTIQASVKSMVGPGTLALKLPSLPKSSTTPQKLQVLLQLAGEPGTQGRPLSHSTWRIVRDGGSQADRLIAQGQTDDQGQICLSDMQQKRLAVALARWPNDIWLQCAQGQRVLTADALGGGSRPDEQADPSALAAMDFTPEPLPSLLTDDGRSHRRRAARDLDQSISSPVHPRLRS